METIRKRRLVWSRVNAQSFVENKWARDLLGREWANIQRAAREKLLIPQTTLFRFTIDGGPQYGARYVTLYRDGRVDGGSFQWHWHWGSQPDTLDGKVSGEGVYSYITRKLEKAS